MARLPYLNPEDVPAEYRALFLEQLSVPGRQAIHIMKILANAPALLPKFSAMGGALLAGQGLDPKLRELALEAVGIASGCEYEYVHHWNIALARAGVPREQLAHIRDYETSPLFNAGERAVIRYALEVTRDVRVSDGTFAAVRELLGDPQLMELVLVVAFYNMVVRILEPLQVELEPGVKKN
ncbi:MAG TPA: carboxymuconolactone decarboxylase family protein [Candidatus Binataceae bacterium]|nr:carboxymuconolactone decarboxylase family protein [Candidatus Binataceae bacterium]